MTAAGGDTRFLVELEFVQCLANPFYLHHLAQEGYLDDPAFLRFLRYLRYFSRPPYVRYVAFPHALAYLELLADDGFRERLKHPEFVQECQQRQQEQ